MNTKRFYGKAKNFLTKILIRNMLPISYGQTALNNLFSDLFEDRQISNYYQYSVIHVSRKESKPTQKYKLDEIIVV